MPEKREPGEVGIAHTLDLKNVERADLETIAFALTSVAIDNGMISTRLCLAILAWSARMRCRQSCLLSAELWISLLLIAVHEKLFHAAIRSLLTDANPSVDDDISSPF